MPLVAADGQGAEPLPAGDQRDGEPLHRPADRHLRRASRGLPQPGLDRVRPGLLQHPVKLRQHRLVGVAGRGEPQPAPLVGGVHHAPLAEPGHHQLWDERHRQLDVQGLGEQLARLGEEGQPGRPADVRPAQPVVLEVQREPFGGQHRQWPGVRRWRRVQLELAGVRPVHGEWDHEQLVVRPRLPAVPGEHLAALAVAPVQPDHAAGGAHHLGEPGQQLGRELRQRIVRVRVGVGLHQLAHRGGARGAARRVRGGDRRRVLGRHRPDGVLAVVPVEPEPHTLPGGQVGGAPPAGEVVDQQQPAPTLGHLGDVRADVAYADHQLLDRAGREVGDRDGQPRIVRFDLDVQLGTRVLHRVGGEFRGE